MEESKSSVAVKRVNKNRPEVTIEYEDGASRIANGKFGSVGYDVAVLEDTFIPAHSRVIVPTGIHLGLPINIEANIRPRSGLSCKGMLGDGRRVKWTLKFGFLPWRTVIDGEQRWNADVLEGTVDPCYTDAVGVIVRNNGEAFTVRKGLKIAQIVFNETKHPKLTIVDKVECEFDRGGGFGHTGAKVEQK